MSFIWEQNTNYYFLRIFLSMDGGDIFVCKANFSGVFVQQRLHGHTERIHSLAWQPSRKARSLITPCFPGYNIHLTITLTFSL